MPSATDSTIGYSSSMERGTPCRRLNIESSSQIATDPSAAARRMFHRSGRLAKRHTPL